jgi:hypothetical protein
MSDAVCGWQAGRDFSDPTQGSAAEQTIAKNSVEALMNAYPGYSWFVEVRDGLLMIRNYEVDWRGRYCMVRKLGLVQHDYGRLVREIVHAAGEYLERAHLRRGRARENEMSKILEGADKYTPAPSGILLPSSEGL